MIKLARSLILRSEWDGWELSEMESNMIIYKGYFAINEIYLSPKFSLDNINKKKYYKVVFCEYEDKYIFEHNYSMTKIINVTRKTFLKNAIKFNGIMEHELKLVDKIFNTNEDVYFETYYEADCFLQQYLNPLFEKRKEALEPIVVANALIGNKT